MATWRLRERGPEGEHADRPSLELVLAHYNVHLKSNRNKQMILCPLGHENRTPSCSILLDEGLWNCLSCGKSGDVYTLIMMREGGCDFARARAISAELIEPAQDTKRGRGQVRGGSRYVRRDGVPGGSRTERGDGVFKPSWRGSRPSSGT